MISGAVLIKNAAYEPLIVTKLNYTRINNGMVLYISWDIVGNEPRGKEFTNFGLKVHLTLEKSHNDPKQANENSLKIPGFTFLDPQTRSDSTALRSFHGWLRLDSPNTMF